MNANFYPGPTIVPLSTVRTSVTACRHPEHNPPQHISLQPGGYSWTCPGCGYSLDVTVSGGML